MAADASVLTELPTWIQMAIGVGIAIATAASGLVVAKHNRKKAEDEDHESLDAEDFLKASPIQKFLDAINTMANNSAALAENSRLQTEALKTISATAIAIARTYEEDFDERRILREVERRLKEAGEKRGT